MIKEVVNNHYDKYVQELKLQQQGHVKVKERTEGGDVTFTDVSQNNQSINLVYSITELAASWYIFMASCTYILVSIHC